MDPFTRKRRSKAQKHSDIPWFGSAEEEDAREQTLWQSFSTCSQTYRVRWTVDARKLKSTDREKVSPLFELGCGPEFQFRMVMRPKKMDDNRGGACFKRARGRGTVELKLVTG